ncbi:SICA antigen [Plasmodium coatneyi]|uniref:SICA antigen n=1 Tax=Plasmodium coatneyi TaxID=208452 RepID=A0A1B1E813_9APIC|nr:SICA antigen [Plasmodium coatneyi]ANQ11080.1 SICA antigen [Plasmodium coatneyi]
MKERVNEISDFRYFSVPFKRKRHRSVHQVRGPPSLEEQLLPHVDDQADGPREYYIVKERKPRSTPIKRRKKRAHSRAGVRRRMIIDIHLEVLDECQKGELHSTREDFFEILVRQFMGSKFMKEDVPMENVPKEEVPKQYVPEEEVPSSDSGFGA